MSRPPVAQRPPVRPQGPTPTKQGFKSAKGVKTGPKHRPIKKAVNYERQFGASQPAAHVPPAQPAGSRKHSDTLASMPMSEKMKAFESGAADSRRSMWIKRAEEKKGTKPKAPKGKAPTPPPKPHAKPATGSNNEHYRQSVRASPAGVASLRSNFQPGSRSPKTAPRKAAPRPPTKPASAPPAKAVPTSDEVLRQQEEAELAEFEARQRREEEAARQAVEEERRRRAEEERKKKEEAEAAAISAEREKERRKLEQQQKKATAAAGIAGGKRAIEVLISVSDYEGNSGDGELSFGDNDFILLMKRDESGWWQGDIAGQIGWFPSNFVRETEAAEYETYCSQWGIEPYFEEESISETKQTIVKSKPPIPKSIGRSTGKTTAAAVSAKATNSPTNSTKNVKKSVEMSKEKCEQCGKQFSVVELNKAVKVAAMRIHPTCMTAFRKAQGDLKKIEFGAVPKSMDDFEIQGLLGKGRFGKVYQCLKRDNGKIYAIKALLKTHIESSEAQKVLVEREKSILQKINGPFLVRCYHIFEDSEKLYFVMECASGGELFVHLSRERIFDPERVRFYAAEMFLALEYLHGLGIVYRDMKPENVLLTSEGHILMTDFGISKEGLDNNDMRTATFCGTPEYLAPEVLMGKGYGKSVDYWSYGSVVYEMLTGLPPFFSEDVTEMYKKILQAPLEIPAECDRASRDFLLALLDRNPDKRLQDPRIIRRHPYFKGINWEDMYNEQVPAPYIPPEEFVYDDSDEAGDDGEFDDFDFVAEGEGEEEFPDDGLVRAISGHDWPGDTEADLPLYVNQVLIVDDNFTDPEGWWEGHYEVDGQEYRGSFPSNFVTLI